MISRQSSAATLFHDRSHAVERTCSRNGRRRIRRTNFRKKTFINYWFDTSGNMSCPPIQPSGCGLSGDCRKICTAEPFPLNLAALSGICGGFWGVSRSSRSGDRDEWRDLQKTNRKSFSPCGFPYSGDCSLKVELIDRPLD